MKASEIDFNYPMLGIHADGMLSIVRSLEDLTIWGPGLVNNNEAKDLILFDAAGRQWRLVSFEKKGRVQSLLAWPFLSLIGGQKWHVEVRLQQLETLSLDEAKRLVCLQMETLPELFVDSDGSEFQDVIKGEFLNAKSIKEIIDLEVSRGSMYLTD